MICAILAILFSILSIPLNVFAAMNIDKEVIETEVLGEFVEVVDRREENVRKLANGMSSITFLLVSLQLRLGIRITTQINNKVGGKL